MHKLLSKLCLIAMSFILLSGFTASPADEFERKYVSEEIELCSTSSVKTYMDYRMITNKQSTQWKYIEAYMHVDEETGLLMDDEGFIGVALGSYFGPIGTKYYVTLSEGQTIPIVKIEAKADQHVSNGCEHLEDHSVIEMVIDADIAGEYYGRSWGYVLGGNFNKDPNFKGEITKMEKVTDQLLEPEEPVEPETPEPGNPNPETPAEDAVLVNTMYRFVVNGEEYELNNGEAEIVDDVLYYRTEDTISASLNFRVTELYSDATFVDTYYLVYKAK